MDHLRALAMLAGVFFHAALAYSPMAQPLWPLADRQASVIVDAVAWGLHLVRMPLFFLVAGYFAAFALQRQGGVALARQRLRRLLLPFLVAWPLTWLAMSASTSWALAHVEHPSAFLVFVREWLAQPGRPRVPPGTAHLWFLYYLMMLSVLHWVARTLEWAPLARRLLDGSPARVLVGLPLLLTPVLASTGVPFPAPEGLLPQFWPLAFYGTFYALGALLQGRPDWLPRLRPWLGPGLVACLLAYGAFLCGLDRLVRAAAPAATAPWWMAALQAALAVWLVVGALWLGQRWLDRPRPLMRYLAHGAYWTYLWHLPLLFACQYWLMDRDWPWPLKFAAACATTLALCLASYQLLVRHTPLRRYVG